MLTVLLLLIPPSLILHNGIKLPEPWPPDVTVEQLQERKPPKPPYLTRRPRVIAIDKGRQLFVDDFLVLWSNATRTFHRAIHRGTVLEPLHSDPASPLHYFSMAGLRSARPFSGGVWYDDVKGRFVMHYRCFWKPPGQGSTCIAYSQDGVVWRRAKLTAEGSTIEHNRTAKVIHPPKQISKRGPISDFGSHCPDPPDDVWKPNLYMLHPEQAHHRPTAPAELWKYRVCGSESTTTWLDHTAEPDSGERWKAVTRHTEHNNKPMTKWASANGDSWQLQPVGGRHKPYTGEVADRAAFYYDPFQSKWVFSIRDNLCRSNRTVLKSMRISRYFEASSFAHADWDSPFHSKEYFSCSNPKTRNTPMPWLGPDAFDCQGHAACDLYHTDVVAYESLMVGTFAFFYNKLGVKKPVPGRVNGMQYPSICKHTELHLGFSRDGFHFSRADQYDGAKNHRLPFAPSPQHIGLWYQQPVAGNFLVVGDEIFFYYSGVNCSVANMAMDRWAESHPPPIRVNKSVTKGPAHSHPTAAPLPQHPDSWTAFDPSYLDVNLSEVTALAVFRRDGFASLGAPAAARESADHGASEPQQAANSSETAVVLTNALTFKRGAYLFVNVDATHGELRVGVFVSRRNATCKGELSKASFASSVDLCELHEVPSLSLAACDAIRGVNHTKLQVTWAQSEAHHHTHTLKQLQDRAVHLQFVLHGAVELFSFWVSPSPMGESLGHVAGGGPGFHRGMDGAPKEQS